MSVSPILFIADWLNSWLSGETEYCIRYTKYNCQELFSRCDHLEDTMVEEAIALDSVYYGGYSLMASVN